MKEYVHVYYQCVHTNVTDSEMFYPQRVYMYIVSQHLHVHVNVKILALRTAIIELRQTLQGMVIEILLNNYLRIEMFYEISIVQNGDSTEAHSLHSNLWQYSRDLRSIRKQKRNEIASEYALLKLILK